MKVIKSSKRPLICAKSINVPVRKVFFSFKNEIFHFLKKDLSKIDCHGNVKVHEH